MLKYKDQANDPVPVNSANRDMTALEVKEPTNPELLPEENSSTLVDDHSTSQVETDCTKSEAVTIPADREQSETQDLPDEPATVQEESSAPAEKKAKKPKKKCSKPSIDKPITVESSAYSKDPINSMPSPSLPGVENVKIPDVILTRNDITPQQEMLNEAYKYQNLEKILQLQDPNNPGYTIHGFPINNLIFPNSERFRLSPAGQESGVLVQNLVASWTPLSGKRKDRVRVSVCHEQAPALEVWKPKETNPPPRKYRRDLMTRRGSNRHIATKKPEEHEQETELPCQPGPSLSKQAAGQSIAFTDVPNTTHGLALAALGNSGNYSSATVPTGATSGPQKNSSPTRMGP